MIYSCTIKRNVSSNIQSYVNAKNSKMRNFFGESWTADEILAKSYGPRESTFVKKNFFDGFSVK